MAAIALDGSHAAGSARAGGDWDLGVYYRAGEHGLDADDVRALGYTGEVSALGAWGPIVNGVRDSWSRHPVDVLFRDLELVEHWLQRGLAGRFEILDQHRCLVRAPE